jgi:formylglycine-generating enzyme required for sulfatase activity/uncharacterized protein YheU (UPF0270 family)
MANLPIPYDPGDLQSFPALSGDDVELTLEQVEFWLKWFRRMRNAPGIDEAERKLRARIIAEAEGFLMRRLSEQQTHKSRDNAAVKPTVSPPASTEELAKTAERDIFDIKGDIGTAANTGSGTTLIDGGVVGGDKYESVVGKAQKVYVIGDKPYQNLLNEQKNISGLTEAAQAYLEWRQEAARRVPLGKLDLAMSPSDRSNPNIYLKDIFIPLDIKRARREDGTKHVNVSVLDSVNRQRKLVILGDPGSGKTTLLNYLTLTLAEARLFPGKGHLDRLSLKRTKDRAAVNWGHGALLPVRIDLRELVRDVPSKKRRGDASLVWEHIANRLEARSLGDFFEELRTEVREGRALVMFDGLDEIIDLKQRTIVRNAVECFAESNPKSRYLVTCRELSYTGREWRLESFTDATLAPLNHDGIKSFISHWYLALANLSTLSREAARAKARELLAAAERLADLAQNPMLLTVMAVVHTYKGHLPRERARLYDDCVSLLLWDWQRAKQNASGEWEKGIVEELGTREERLINGLAEVALQAHRDSDGKTSVAHIPQSKVESILRRYLDDDPQKAQRFCQYVEKRAGLLIGKGQDQSGEPIYAFPHRGFQEFLAARALVNDWDFGRCAAELAREGDIWHEVLRLAVGHLVFNDNNVTRPISAINIMVRRDPPKDEAGWRAVWLAGEMLSIVGRSVAEQDELIGREASSRLMDQLVMLVEGGRLTSIERAQAADILGWLGDPRPGVSTPVPKMIRLAGGAFSMGANGAQHRVTVEPFHLAAYPVTNEQFRAFARTKAYHNDKYWTEAGIKWRKEATNHGGLVDESWWGISNRPVVSITWHEAVAYAKWLSARTRKSYRLPTEAEWEFAAAGTKQRKYPFGNRGSDDTTNTREAGIEQTTSVGAFPADKTPEGLYDLGGNVWEWCSSLEKPYPYKAADGREKLDTSGCRILRGGSYHNYRAEIHCTQRRALKPAERWEFIGFRLAMDD